MEVLTFASALDSNMGYNHIKIDVYVQNQFKIVFPREKCKQQYKQRYFKSVNFCITIGSRHSGYLALA
jgi:hypothetical protein